MTITYCGKCGSANGTSARYCRQCGVELSSHASFSAPSKPLVEFIPKGETRAIREDEVADQPRPDQIRITASGSLTFDPPQDSDRGEGQADPVAISKSLRRVRASGSLILEAASKKKQEEMGAIIALAIEGFDKYSEQPEKAPRPPRPPNPVFGKLKRRKQSLPPGDRLKIPNATQPLVIFAETMQAVWRRAVSAIKTPTKVPANTGPVGSGSLIIAPNGPSTVLAQASGLNPRRSLSPKLIGGLLAIALLISVGVYQAIRDRLLSPEQTASSERELQTAEEQSEKNVQLGKEANANGLYDEALTYFQKALSMTPNRAEVVFLIAKTHSAAGQTEDALKAFRAVLRIDPENLEARLSLAQIYRALGNWNAAYQEFQRIIALDQGSKEANVALDAIEKQQAGLAQAAPSPSAPHRGRRPRSVARNSPVLPPAATAQPQMTFLTMEAPATQTIKPPRLESDKKEENLDPRAVAESRKNQGLRYLQVKLYRPALNEFLASLKLTPDDKNIYYFIASAYSGLGQPEQAHDYYKRVDRGPYQQVSQEAAKRTEKAAREAAKRRAEMKNDLGFGLGRE